MIEPKCNDYTMEHHHCLHHLQVSLQFEETFQTEFVGSGFSKENCECSRFSKMGHEQPKLHLGLRNPSHTFCGKSRFRLESPCVQVGILGRGEHPKTFKSKVFWVNSLTPSWMVCSTQALKWQSLLLSQRPSTIAASSKVPKIVLSCVWHQRECHHCNHS